MTRPLWMQEQIEVIIADMETILRSDVQTYLWCMPHHLVCDSVERVWREYSAQYCATWMDYKKGVIEGYVDDITGFKN